MTSASIAMPDSTAEAPSAGVSASPHFFLKKNFSIFERTDFSLTFEKVVRYLPYIRSAIQVPIYVIGIDV